jgi:leucyl aminopeptidase
LHLAAFPKKTKLVGPLLVDKASTGTHKGGLAQIPTDVQGFGVRFGVRFGVQWFSNMVATKGIPTS